MTGSASRITSRSVTSKAVTIATPPPIDGAGSATTPTPQLSPTTAQPAVSPSAEEGLTDPTPLGDAGGDDEQ